MKTNKKIYFGLLAAIIMFAACEKPEPTPDTPQAKGEGIYILNEGMWNMNNSTISFYNLQTGEVIPDIFLSTNRRGLGDTGNDLQAYGSKLYCIVNTSEIVEVMNFSDCRSIKQISLQGKSPRKIAFYESYGYVSCFDGSVVKIDTATLEIVAVAQAGRNPEGLCVANGKLYVANSGGLDYPNYDNTVSIFDLSTFSLIKNIEVVCNPAILLADEEGDVYLLSIGDYGATPSAFQRINTQSDEVAQTFDFSVMNFTISGNRAYLYDFNYVTNEASFMVMDLNSETIINDHFISDGTQIQTPYAIFAHPTTGDVYIADAGDYTVNGDIYCFSSNGRKKFSFESGISPAHIVYKKAQ